MRPKDDARNHHFRNVTEEMQKVPRIRETPFFLELSFLSRVSGLPVWLPATDSRICWLMRAFRPLKTPPRQRSGTTAAEVAVTLPVFCMVMAGLMECGHAMMVIQSLETAARQAARYGAVDEITSAQTIAKAQTVMSKSIRVVPTVVVKDGSSFDSAGFNASTINYSSLPNKELSTATDDQMFIVRVSVPYNSVALLPPFWIKNVTLTGQAVMRHE